MHMYVNTWPTKGVMVGSVVIVLVMQDLASKSAL